MLMNRLSTDFSTIPVLKGNEAGWRYRAKLAVRHGPKVGLFKPGTHEVEDLVDCPDHHPVINEALRILRKMTFVPYDEKTGVGDLRYVQFTLERHSGKVQLVLVSNGEGHCDQLAAALEKEHEWHSIWINTQTGSTNTIFGQKWKRVCGKETLEDLHTHFHPACFIQANLDLFDVILHDIRMMLKKGLRFTEFYAGVGAISLACVDQMTSCTLVEINPFAERCFEKAKAPIHLKFVTGPTEKHVDLLDEGLIVDPPRKGLDRVLLEAIKSSDLKQIVYLSCNEETLKRDLEELLNLGWLIEDVKRYTLFPGTSHIETLVSLTNCR